MRKSTVILALFALLFLITDIAPAMTNHCQKEPDNVIIYTDDYLTGLSWKAEIEAFTGMEVHVFDFNNVKGRSLMSVDYFRQNNHMQYLRPKAVFFQLGCDGIPDKYDDYEQILFDHPTGEVCTLTGKMARNKRIAISKPDENIKVDNFAGALYFMIRSQRVLHRDARAFILPPAKAGEDADTQSASQLRKLANMMCLPFLNRPSELKEYTFLWNGMRPNFGKMLILGDSYCHQRRWINSLEQMADVEVVNLGVTSASMRDHFTDRNAYPYNPNPIPSDCEGNHNTLACQILKLKRLISGQKLLPGETALNGWTPDIILVEGGGNDFADSPEVEALYEAHILEDNRTSFAGANAHMERELKALFPKAQIFFVVSAGLYYRHTDKPFEFIDKARQQRKAAQMLGCPTINWDIDGRLSFIYNNSAKTGDGTKERPFRYNPPTTETLDLIHPSDYGAQFLAESAVHWITKFYNK